MPFIKKVEDFVCEKCGAEIEGSGYTNHCSKCLWSKHVDIDPGDRLSECGGMMEPVEIEEKSGSSRVVHKCLKCDIKRPSPVLPNDDFDKVVEVAKKRAEDN